MLKANCFTHLHEHELVKMAVRGLFYSIRKKLDTQYLRDIAKLADRVRQGERLKDEKAKRRKFHKKDKFAYIKADERDQDYDVGYERDHS